jgi:hypothetical protein
MVLLYSTNIYGNVFSLTLPSNEALDSHLSTLVAKLPDADFLISVRLREWDSCRRAVAVRS